MSSRTTAGEPVCSRCFRSDPANHGQCTTCGRAAVVIRGENGSVRCRRCYRPPLAICTLCNLEKPCYLVSSSTPRCGNCSRQMRREPCTRCGRSRAVWTRAAAGQPLCGSCSRQRVPCTGCGSTRTVAARIPAGPLCSTCYRKHPASFQPCTECGTTERLYHHGLCTRCACRQHLLSLLSHDQGSLHPHAEAIYHVLAASDPVPLMNWLTRGAASKRTLVDEDRFGELTACDTRRTVYGAGRRAILTHSPELRDSQAAGFDGTTLAKAGKKLDELAAALSRGRTRRPRDKVEAEIGQITSKPWVRRVIRWQLDGDKPKDLRLTWHIDQDARAALEEEIFGKHVLITSHDDWPAAEVIAGYRSQSEAESSFRQLKDPHVVSFSPMHHWTDHNIRVHVFTCVLALQLAHLMRYRARQAGLDLSVRELLGQLAAIGETVLIYPSTGGRPKARRMTTELTGHQPQLHQIFGLARWAPKS